MKIKDIQIDGFGVWTGLSVDALPDGMTLFFGPNEAGKTTLMQFVRAMLYGFTPTRRERYLPPVYGGTPGGAMRVTGPGGGYEIRRTSQLTDADVVGRLSVTGQDGLSQGQHRLGSLLGNVDESIFSNVFAIGIRELQELSSLDDTAAADELYKLSSGLDRVSLVDVMRNLRGGRQDIVGKASVDDDTHRNRLIGLLSKRDKLRQEIQQLTQQGRRWSELAGQRRVQNQEIQQLAERMTAWERESRCVETATSVYDTWHLREQLSAKIAEVEVQTDLPDDAPAQLIQIEAMMDERKQKLEEIKTRRREIRDKAEQLPVSKRMLELQGRIEAASEQATWIEALEDQIHRLDEQIEKARKQLDSDADRLGMDDVDRQAIVEGDSAALPDLSKNTLAALAQPARDVKENLYVLKQARGEGSGFKRKAEALGEELRETLRRAGATNLQEAIRHETEAIGTLRQRIQLGEHLEKLRRHYRDLERESVELTTDEALPVDRMLLLGVPFFVGGVALCWGFFNLFNIDWFVTNPDPTKGIIAIMFSFMAFMAFYFGREQGRRTGALDLEDCERQIETIRRQIRELEIEKSDVDSSLPGHTESLEVRLRESEKMLAELESLVPTYHAQQAAAESYKAARDRATRAAAGLKEARRNWSSTLDRLGLSDSMSPASVRKLSDGYETLQTSLRRVAELKNERELRLRERQTIAKRIEDLYLESIEVQRENAMRQDQRIAQIDDEDDAVDPSMKSSDSSRNDQRQRTQERDRIRDRDSDRQRGQDRNRDRRGDRVADHRVTPSPAISAVRSGPLEQLHHMQEEMSRQRHWIKRRRSLKEQDDQYKKQQSAHVRTIERCEQQRRSLWAKCGVATAEQFYEIVDRKAQLLDMRKAYADADKQVRTIIGTHVDYDAVAKEIAGVKPSDLERRYDALATRMSETETRIATLRTHQGEIAQEMKQLGEDGRLTITQLELECCERQIAACVRRWQTLAISSHLLEDVCNTFERERQPETLREASSFLSQLTDGKYTRIWTPLGTNKLKIDDADGKALPLDVLSRGTGEAVFIALRLSLAASYARRGVTLPLVLDDVLVNFDHERAAAAARTLKTFAELGHQVMMFTCHQHIVDIFHDIDVQVRRLPQQGVPGRAMIVYREEDPAEIESEYYEEEAQEEEVAQEEVTYETEDEPVAEAAPAKSIRFVQRRLRRPQPKPVVVEVHPPAPQSAPIRPSRPARPLPQPQPAPRYEYVDEVQYIDQPPRVGIDWAWFQREPADGQIDRDEQAAEIARSEWLHDDPPRDAAVDDQDSWWNGRRMAAS